MITKQELIEENKRLKEKFENLELEFNNLNDLYSEMENKCAEVQKQN